MATETTSEKRIRRLEDALLALKGLLEGIKHKLGQVAEDNARAAQPLGSGGASLYRAQVSEPTGIPSSAGNDVGVGKAKLLRLVDGHRYQRVPPKEVDVVNDTGGTIPLNTYLVVALFGGSYTVLVADCVTVDPAEAPAPPEEA